MSKDNELSHAQIKAIAQHMQEVVNAITDANNELIRRLHASPTFGDQDRTTLNQWSLVINDIHSMSDARIMELHSQEAPRGVQ